MLFLPALSLLLLVLPKLRISEGVVVVLYIAACAGIRARGREALRPKHLLWSALCSGFLSLGFFFRWREHSFLMAISNRIGANPRAVMALISAGLCLCSIPMLDAFLSRLLERFDPVSKRGAACGGKLARIEVLACAAIALLTALQFATSPISGKALLADNSIFLYIGRAMHRGFMPYRDVFDHKGPVLYLLNWLGLFLSAERAAFLGVWLLEFLNMFAFACMLLKLLHENAPGGGHASLHMILCAVLCVYCGSFVYFSGNMTEEFALPWIAAALRVFFRYFRTHAYQNRDVFTLGAGLGIALCLRPNLIGPWAVFTPMVIASLLMRRRFADVGRCALYYSIGLGAVLIPILAWLLATDSLSAMWECYIRFNFAYSGDGFSLRKYALTMLIMLQYVPFLLAALLLTLPLARNSVALRMNFVAAVGTLALVSMSCRDFCHYAIPMLPFLALPLAALSELAPERGERNGSPAARRALCAVLLCSILCAGVREAHISWKGRKLGAEELYVRENTAPDDDVLVIGSRARIYLLGDRCTRNRFIHQGTLLQTNDALYEEFLDEMEIHPSDVILVVGSGGRSEDLTSGGSLARVYRHLDDMYRAGKFTLEEYDTFYVYRRVEA